MKTAHPKEGRAVPLVAAAAALKLRYRTTLDRVLCGDLVGWQDGRRRWWVAEESLRQYADRSKTEAPAA
jgi:hypothetical protein